MPGDLACAGGTAAALTMRPAATPTRVGSASRQLATISEAAARTGRFFRGMRRIADSLKSVFCLARQPWRLFEQPRSRGKSALNPTSEVGRHINGEAEAAADRPKLPVFRRALLARLHRSGPLSQRPMIGVQLPKGVATSACWGRPAVTRTSPERRMLTQLRHREARSPLPARPSRSRESRLRVTSVVTVLSRAELGRNTTRSGQGRSVALRRQRT